MAYYDLKTNEIWADSNIAGFHDEHIEIDEVIAPLIREAQCRVVLQQNRKLQLDIFLKKDQAYIQRLHKSYSYHNAEWNGSTFFASFHEIFAKPLDKRNVVL